jgi:DNA helicase-2/ATP-dependent DNA helicase PcrA
VDEYQDCSTRQHVLATWAAQALPTAVLGDPLQAIFGFGSDGLADWNNDVLAYFPLAGELDTPWRWINAQAQPLGQWLLNVRTQLLQGQPVDLQQAPAGVAWVHLDGTDDHNRCLQAARVNPPGNIGSVLVLGDSMSPPSQQRIANQTPGAVTVEAVHLNDLVNFARSFDPSSANALQALLDFAKSVMRNSGATAMMQRVSSLQNGTAHNPATDAENAALAFLAAPSFGSAATVLAEINKQSGVSVHRPAVLRACLRALQACKNDGGSLLDAAVKMREQNRLIGRPLPKRAVGSTLLLKGLEAEAAVILNASDLNARHLYVAMTRGSKSLTICARAAVLTPQW